jgi:protein TonB
MGFVAPIKRACRLASGSAASCRSAKLIRQPKPVYPQPARQARIQGVVRLHALISRDGTIEGLKVASGHPLLVPFAL